MNELGLVFSSFGGRIQPTKNPAKIDNNQARPNWICPTDWLAGYSWLVACWPWVCVCVCVWVCTMRICSTSISSTWIRPFLIFLSYMLFSACLNSTKFWSLRMLCFFVCIFINSVASHWLFERTRDCMNKIVRNTMWTTMMQCTRRGQNNGIWWINYDTWLSKAISRIHTHTRIVYIHN